MGSDMSEMRIRAAIGVTMVALGLGLVACTDATQVNPNPPEAPIQIVTWDLRELPRLAVAKAEPPAGIPCDPGKPAGENVDPEVEPAPAEDPYAG